MKELTVSPGDERDKTWLKAWQLFRALGSKEPVCFRFNDARVIIISDDSWKATTILSDEEAKKIVENVRVRD